MCLKNAFIVCDRQSEVRLWPRMGVCANSRMCNNELYWKEWTVRLSSLTLQSCGRVSHRRDACVMCLPVVRWHCARPATIRLPVSSSCIVPYASQDHIRDGSMSYDVDCAAALWRPHQWCHLRHPLAENGIELDGIGSDDRRQYKTGGRLDPMVPPCDCLRCFWHDCTMQYPGTLPLSSPQFHRGQ
jgi:hypothetical protein